MGRGVEARTDRESQGVQPVKVRNRENVGRDRGPHVLFHLFVGVLEASGNRRALVVESFVKSLGTPHWTDSDEGRALAASTLNLYPRLWERYRTGALTSNMDVFRWALGEYQAQLSIGADESIRRDLHELLTRLGRAGHARRPWGREHRVMVTTIKRLGEMIDANHEVLPGHFDEVDDQVEVVTKTAPIDVQESRRFWRKGKTRIRCVRVLRETHDVSSFIFESTEGLGFEYLPGQSATIEVPIDGRLVRRTYTICSTPTRPDRLKFTIKRVPEGLVSNWMIDHVAPGLELDIRGPGGSFSWAVRKPRKVLFLSAGSGVTPLLSMSRYIHDRGDAVDVVFWHGGKTPEDLIARLEVEMIAKQRSSFRVVWCLSRVPEDSPWAGPRGRLSVEMLTATVPDFMERAIYFCGPMPVQALLENLLDEVGFPRENFFQESFGGKPTSHQNPVHLEKESSGGSRVSDALRKIGEQVELESLRRISSVPHTLSQISSVNVETAPKAEAEGRKEEPEGRSSDLPDDYTAVLTESKASIRVAPDQFLLDSLEDEGYGVDSSCRSGSCGTCKVRLTEGSVEMELDSGLSSEEASEGYVLACVARPCSNLRLEL